MKKHSAKQNQQFGKFSKTFKMYFVAKIMNAAFAATFMIDGEINTHKLQNHVVTLVVQCLNVYFPIAVFVTELNTINLDPFCRGLYL